MAGSAWKNPRRLIPAAVFCVFLWGSAAPFIKWGYLQFGIAGGDTPAILQFAGLRFFLAGLMVILAGSLRRKKPLLPAKRDLGPIFVLAFFQTIAQYFFYYVGLAHTSAASGAILTGTGAFISLLVAALLFHYERLSLNKLAGCLLGFLGILVMNLGGLTGFSFSFSGEGFILLSQVSSALSAAFIKKYTQSRDAVLLSGWQFAFGGLLLWLTGFVQGGSLSLASLPGLADLAYLAFVSAAAYTIWGFLLQYNPISKIGMYNCLIPLFGVLWSAMLLHENAFEPQTLAALVLIMGGILLVNRPGKATE